MELPERFQVHSTLRKPETKVQRAQAVESHRGRIMLGGGVARVVKARATVISKDVLMRLLPELQDKERKGMLKVTLMNGQRLDLNSLEPTGSVPESPALPNPQLDSAANDKTFEHGVGEHKPSLPGGKPAGIPLPLPEVIAEAIRFEEPMQVEAQPTPVPVPVPEPVPELALVSAEVEIEAAPETQLSSSEVLRPAVFDAEARVAKKGKPGRR